MVKWSNLAWNLYSIELVNDANGYEHEGTFYVAANDSVHAGEIAIQYYKDEVGAAAIDCRIVERLADLVLIPG